MSKQASKMREYIQQELGIELYDIYGLTEIYGSGTGISKSSGHIKRSGGIS